MDLNWFVRPSVENPAAKDKASSGEILAPRRQFQIRVAAAGSVSAAMLMVDALLHPTKPIQRRARRGA
jgi:hypothetical protein